MNYATIDDISCLWRPLTEQERTRATQLIDVVCSTLRTEAKSRGKDLDLMMANDTDLQVVTKSVVVDIVARTLMTSTDQEPMTQMSQSALGYSFSGTFLVPGGGLFIKKSELEKLGIVNKKQCLRGIEMGKIDD